ncbi:Retrovirus-related Pol polyprotein from transposon RE2 [Vitis vinifera]|uniref:Retrovirus-related Pol polyprotein from transposon RE2 n=1 Tax=Vitis vinifera TaxID=29760 RepID=A0A438JWK7_VITVI|nr:Retrovirus-related Pol polyprotein from transposon RE2 [Vitis vinifera]
MFLFECYAVTMLGDIFLHPLLLLCPNMGSSISHLVLIFLKKMGLLNVKIDILLRQLVPSFSIVMFLFVFGGMLFLQPVTRMPSSILHDQIPHFLFFPTQPLYFLPRVFGCTCFVHTLTPGQDKLSAKAMKCIFLGYSRLQKGYRCSSPNTHRYFLSADVTFFEDSPFFSSFESLPIFEVYHRRHHAVAPPLSSAEVPSDSPPVPPISLTLTLSSTDCLPIALRKGNRSTRNPHPIYNFLSYHRLSSSYSAFVSTLSSVSLPKSTSEALSDLGWRQAMVDEMAALHSNDIWDLVSLPPGKSTVECRWVYTAIDYLHPILPLSLLYPLFLFLRALVRHFLILGGDKQWLMKWLLCTPMTYGILFLYLLVDRLKTRLVAKGYTQIYGCNYSDTFSPVAKIASVHLFLSMGAMSHWPLYQLDIKNVFLHGELLEEVYMEQPPDFVAQGEFGLVCKLRRSLYGLKQSPRVWFGRFSSVVQEFGMLRSEANHSVFYHHNSSSQCIYLVVYVDDIVITSSDQEGVVISQRKYALDILEETGMLECKPVDTSMDPNVKLVPGQGEPLRDPGRYRRLVGKLNYLSITRPDISFPVSVAKVCCMKIGVIPKLLVTQMQTGLVHPQIGVPPQGIVFLLEVALLAACVRRGLKVLSATGAGARADPTRIRVADLRESTNDPLSRSLAKMDWVPLRSILDMMYIKFNGFGSSKRGIALWQAANIALIRIVWRERNARIFEDKARNSESLWDSIVFLTSLWAYCSKAFAPTARPAAVLKHGLAAATKIGIESMNIAEERGLMLCNSLGPLLGVDNLPFQLKYLRRNTYLGCEIELTRPFTNNAKSDGDEGRCQVMAMKVRHRLRKDYGIEGGIPVVFSLEKPKVKLLPFKGSNGEEENPSDYQVRMIACYFEIVPGFRVRIIPVLGTIPAIFGQIMASYVVTQLAGFQVHTEPVVNLDTDHYHILHQRLIEHEELLYGTAMQVQGNLMIP